MDVMRTGCSMLGNLEPEGDFENQQRAADRLLGALPSIINYWYQYSHHGNRIDTDSDEDSLAGHFLKTLSGALRQSSPACNGRSLILYAEHELMPLPLPRECAPPPCQYA